MEQKLVLLRPPIPHSVETTIANRRLDEQYCLKLATCLVAVQSGSQLAYNSDFSYASVTWRRRGASSNLGEASVGAGRDIRTADGL
jgi:hypothetical protein